MMDGNPKSRNGGMVEWQKMTPNPKTCLYRHESVWHIHPHDDDGHD